MTSSFAIRVYGYIILAVGVSNAINDFTGRLQYSSAEGLATITADCAILFIAGITLALASSLQRLERRLDKLEKKDSEK